jgi:hypothetical protein
MSRWKGLQTASVSPEGLEAIRRLENKLGPNVRLVAVKKKETIFALEAKVAPNSWKRVDEVYPEIKGLKAYYAGNDLAKEAKGWLKCFLIHNTLSPKPKKYPIRIRQVVDAGLVR